MKKLIITENQFDRLVNNLLNEDSTQFREDKLRQLKKQFPRIKWGEIEGGLGDFIPDTHLVGADPTKKLKYLPWIVKQYNDIMVTRKITDISASEFVEDLYKIKEYLEFYEKIKPKLEPNQRNIQSIKDYKDLYDIIKPFQQFEVSPDLSEKETQLIKQGEAIKLYEDNKWFVMTPKTVDAACTFSEGTTWCTKHQGQFDSYSKQGSLYIIHDKIDKENRYQFHLATETYMDEDDRPVEGGIVKWFSDRPELKNVFIELGKKEHRWKFLLSLGYEDWITFVDPNEIRIDLSDLSLNELSEKIGNLQDLTILNVANNNLETLPESIGSLKGLHSIGATRNRLSILPDSLVNLKNVQELMLSNNNFTSIPPVVGRMKRVGRLFLTDNDIPNIISEIKKYPNLKNLSHFIYKNSDLNEQEKDTIKKLLPNTSVSL
ncbi:hypothetical protein COB55_03450 [Candidatus Wolfebacteria bacterium]|nr:MAG: hypothetical protein COB55_03450 [Candidatus Wolfebacteria bacterium]